MAPYTYSYFLALIVLVSTVIALVNVVRFRLFGKPLIGVVVKGSPEEQRMLALSTNRSLLLFSLLLLSTALVIARIISALLSLKTSEATSLIWIAPLCIVIFTGIMVIIVKENQDKLK